MQDVDAGGRELTGEIQALHSRITKLEQVSHNLPGHKNVDEELDNAWREWETTFDAIKDSLILTDSEFTIIQANLAASRLFDRPLDQIAGRTCWQLVHGTNEAPEGCPLKRAKTTKKHEEIELYLPQNGIWAADSVDPVLDQQGRLTGAVHIIKDITDRKRAEGLLLRERDRAQQYLDVAGVMFVAIDAEQRVGLINKKGCEILGCTEEEIIAKNWFDNFLPENIREQIRAVFEKTVSGEISSSEYYENPVLTKNGQERLIAWHNTILRDDKGQVIAALSSGEDITERKKAEEALQHSEEYFRALTENSSDIIMIVDKKGTILYMSSSIERFSGYKPEELIGKSAFDFIHPDDLPRAINDFGRAIQTKDVAIPNSFRVRHKDGLERVLEGIGKNLLDNPVIKGFVMNVRDITDRKRAEEVLRKSEHEKTLVLDNASEIIAYHDIDHNILWANRAYLKATGLSLSQIKGKKCYHAWGLDRLCKDCPVTKTIKTGEPQGAELMPQNQPHWSLDMGSWLSRAAPVKDKTGSIIGAIEVSYDITERKRAEEALRSSENKYRTLLENLPQRIFLKDKNSVYISCNENYSGDLKIRAQDIAGKTDYDFYPKELAEKYRVDDKRIMEEDKTEGFEEEYLQEGEKRWVHTVKTPVKEPHGNLVGILGIFWDITERKKAEQKLLEDQAQLKSLASELTLAEERERHRLATVLHDRISQALVISKIKLDALRKSGHSRKLDKALEDVCDSIGQTIQDTRTLTLDLGNPVLYELGFETAVSEWLTEQIQKKHGIAVEFEDDGENKPLDDDVSILLFRDVRELLINIVKHAGAHKVKVSIGKLDNQICVTVEDDGVGFDPVEVVSMAARRGEFGLFSIRERLEDLGGHLQIDAAPGRGCKVTMTAPLKRKEMSR